MQNAFSFFNTDCICSLTEWKRVFGVLTSTMALGRSSALNSCSMESMMFFQPSLRMLPCRWARSNTVLAAVCALLLLPNTVGRFSTDCRDRGHTINVNRHFDSYSIQTVLLMHFGCLIIATILFAYLTSLLSLIQSWCQKVLFIFYLLSHTLQALSVHSTKAMGSDVTFTDTKIL